MQVKWFLWNLALALDKNGSSKLLIICKAKNKNVAKLSYFNLKKYLYIHTFVWFSIFVIISVENCKKSPTDKAKCLKSLKKIKETTFYF